MNLQVRRTLLKLTGEYAIITAPILIYIVLEIVSHDEVRILYRSPEWSIATIFLIIQTIRMYLDAMHETVGRLFSFLLILFLVGITVASVINIYIALGDVHHQSVMTVAIKWLLFALASLVFVYVAGAAIYSSEQTVA